MKIDILTLFPDAVSSFMDISIIGRARRAGLFTMDCTDIREFTLNKQKQVDDYPYGGGLGMIMQADPLYRALNHVKSIDETPARTILMSPSGKVFDQSAARRLLNYPRLILVCGRYEGVDERFIEECVDEEMSIGDFVMTGGEIAAMAISDAVCRMLPGVLREEECFENESHFSGLLEYPQYSRPEEWQGRKVPEILLGGHHANIEKWRREQSVIRTMLRRPDMFSRAKLSKEDLQAVNKYLKNKD